MNFSVATTRRPNLSPMEQYAQSVAVNAAVNAIAAQISKAKVRLFARNNGEEINGGPLFDILNRPAPKMTTRKFIREIVCWYNIAGKYAIYMNADGAGGTPTRLIPLCPYKLAHEKPTMPRHPGDVHQWRYTWCDGTVEHIRGDYIAYDRMFNPDPTSIDGLSPLVVGAVNTTAQVEAEKYNKVHFENAGVPSHIVVLPDGVPKQHREDFERKYRAEFGTYNSNAHKVMVVAGKDVDVKPIEQPFQDGAFMEMMKRQDLKVGQLYRVPAINMGIYDKTRFDTAGEERKLFLEETLTPECEAISECLQQQVVDVHFAFSKFSVSRPRKPSGNKFASKSAERLFEKARSEHPDSPIVVCIDSDTLPVANEVALARAEYLQKLREAAMLSPFDACEFLGLDFEDDRPERKEIWASGTNIVCITKPELNAKLTPGVGGDAPGDKPKPGGGGESKPKPKTKKEITEQDRQRKTNLKTLIHKFRTLTLKRMADEQLWTIAETDGLAGGDKVLAKEIAKARFRLRQIVKEHADKTSRIAAAKEYFDSLDGAYIRGALGLE
jgi:HK97 family phage portal protein